MAACGESLEWGSIIRDVNRLEEIELEEHGTPLLLPSEVRERAGKTFQAAGVALPHDPAGELTERRAPNQIPGAKPLQAGSKPPSVSELRLRGVEDGLGPTRASTLADRGEGRAARLYTVVVL